jgi:hypothetical protein
MADAARLVPIGEVAAMLGGRAHQLAGELLPHGKRAGHEWHCDSLAGEPSRPGKSGPLCVHLSGAKAGVWKDFRGGESGDALDLVAQVLFRGDKRQALAWSRRWLGLDIGDPAALATARREAKARSDRADEEAKATRNGAFRLWLAAQPSIAGTPVEYYLAGRGIDFASFDRPPRSIRHHPRLWCKEAGTHFAAMVTAICDADGRFVSCHRTWLEQAAPGDWRKARGIEAKKCLGAYKGGLIRLWRGASGKPLRDAPAGEVVDVTEGIEDGLTVAMAAPECRVVAAVTLSNLASLVFPKAVTGLRIWRDNDTSPGAIATFDAAVKVHQARGLAVMIAAVPKGVKDVNELLCAEEIP